MYRSTPVTYLASSLLLTGISGANVTCVPSELLHAIPPSPLTCAQYLSSYLQTSDAHLDLPTPENFDNVQHLSGEQYPYVDNQRGRVLRASLEEFCHFASV